MNLPSQLKTFLDDVLLKAIGDIGDGVIVLDVSRIVYSNEAFSKITGFSEEELSVLPSFLELVCSEDRVPIQENLFAHFENRRTSGRYETTIRNKN